MLIITGSRLLMIELFLRGYHSSITQYFSAFIKVFPKPKCVQICCRKIHKKQRLILIVFFRRIFGSLFYNLINIRSSLLLCNFASYKIRKQVRSSWILMTNISQSKFRRVMLPPKHKQLNGEKMKPDWFEVWFPTPASPHARTCENSSRTLHIWPWSKECHKLNLWHLSSVSLFFSKIVFVTLFLSPLQKVYVLVGIMGAGWLVSWGFLSS